MDQKNKAGTRCCASPLHHWATLLLLILSAGAIQAAHADDIEYAYDEGGRVIQATNRTSGQAVLYKYDAVGNITSQTATPLTTLAIGYFSPSRGPVGAQVVITGTGFSPTPSLDTVQFNGAAASVLSATQTQLVTTVPAGATSGLISVQVGAASASSSTPFVVTSYADGPIITSLTPAIGGVNTSVVINGANFEPVPADNRLRFGNQAAAIIGAPSPTTINTTVPMNAASGRVRLTTPRGVAISPIDFIVPPPGYSAGTIGSTGRIALDTPTSITLSTANRASVQLFDAAAGDLLSIGVNSISLPSCTIKVFRPDNNQLVSSTVTASGQGIQLPKLTISGTYTIVVDAGSSTGSISLSVLRPLQVSTTLDAAPSSITLSPAGRRAIVTFTGTQGTFFNTTLSSVTVSAGTLSIVGPNGVTLTSNTFNTSGLTLPLQLPLSGTYSVLLDPTGSISGSLNIGFTSSASSALAVDQPGYAVNLTSSAPVNLTFRAGAGDYLSLGVSEISGGISAASFTVFKPDGSQLTAGTFSASSCTGGCSGFYVMNMGPMSVAGTYTVVVQRLGSGSGILTLTLSNPVTAALTVGTTSSVQASRVGQGMRLTFAGVAGGYFAVAARESNSNIPGGTITVLRPDGSQITTATLTAPSQAGNGYAGTALANVGPLGASGNYTIIFQQTTGGNGALFWTVSNPVPASLTVGTPADVAVALLGQGMDLTFAGTAGQYLTLGINESYPSSIAGTTAIVLKPDGSLLTTGVFTPIMCVAVGCAGEYAGSGTVNTGPLPATGTYRVVLQQFDAGVGTLHLTVSSPGPGRSSTALPLRFQFHFPDSRCS